MDKYFCNVFLGGFFLPQGMCVCVCVCVCVCTCVFGNVIKKHFKNREREIREKEGCDKEERE